MSGGHFDYKQYEIDRIADQVEQLVRDNNSTEPDRWGDPKGRNYPPEVVEEFKNGLLLLRKAAVYVQRIDWLVSGDDGEDSFLRRLPEDLAQVQAASAAKEGA
jgi:hypothetical protein